MNARTIQSAIDLFIVNKNYFLWLHHLKKLANANVVYHRRQVP